MSVEASKGQRKQRARGVKKTNKKKRWEGKMCCVAAAFSPDMMSAKKSCNASWLSSAWPDLRPICLVADSVKLRVLQLSQDARGLTSASI